MNRLPFDPSKMRGNPAPPQSSDETKPSATAPVTVSQLSTLISQALSAGFPKSIRVIGEVSTFRERTHWYFDLKDAGAVINTVMFAAAARKANFTPEQGQEVIITGRVEFFPKQGRTQLYAESITPVGEGALDLAFRKLYAQLQSQGYFDPQRKRPLPTFPRNIAVITSRSAAALQDVLETLRRRCPLVGVILADVRVQGDSAPPEIAQAITLVNNAAARLNIDAIIVTRGGGSKEDLWAFNEKIVADAIINSRLPIVAAIGHETDTTIAELAADERASTPTQAAMRLSPDVEAIEEQLDALHARITTATARHITARRQQLQAAERHPAIRRPARVLERRQQQLAAASSALTTILATKLNHAHRRLDRAAASLAHHRPEAVYARRNAQLERLAWTLRRVTQSRITTSDTEELSDRLTRAWSASKQRRTLELDAAERALTIVGPPSVLARGYSVTTDQSGKLITNSKNVSPGQHINTRLADGSFRSQVTENPANPTPTTPSTPPHPIPPPQLSRRPSHRPSPQQRKPRRQTNSPTQSPDQLDLFNHPG